MNAHGYARSLSAPWVNFLYGTVHIKFSENKKAPKYYDDFRRSQYITYIMANIDVILNMKILRN